MLPLNTQYFAYSDGGQQGSGKRRTALQLAAFKYAISGHAMSKGCLIPPPPVHLYRSILLDEDWHKTQTRTLSLARLSQFTQTMKFYNSFPSVRPDRLCSMTWRAASSSYLGVGKETISRVLTTLLANLPYLRHFKLVVSGIFIVEVSSKVIGHESTHSCFTRNPLLIPSSFSRGVTCTVHKIFSIFFMNSKSILI